MNKTWEKLTTKCTYRYVKIEKIENGVKTVKFTPVFCKSWDCPHCRRVKAYKVKAKMREFAQNNRVYLLTLTHPHNCNVELAWKEMGKLWNRFRTYVKRKYGHFSYIRILEPHKGEPYPHIHAIINVALDKKDIASRLTGWGFGWNWSLQPISTGGAVSYVSKYLTKDWPKNFAQELRKRTKARIVQASQDLGAIFTTKSGWKIVDQHANPRDVEGFIISTFAKYTPEQRARIQLRNEIDTFAIIFPEDLQQKTKAEDDWSCPEIDLYYHPERVIPEDKRKVFAEICAYANYLYMLSSCQTWQDLYFRPD